MDDKSVAEIGFEECEKTCTYDIMDCGCNLRCSNCGTVSECFYPYWRHCPVCGFKITNGDKYFRK